MSSFVSRRNVTKAALAAASGAALVGYSPAGAGITSVEKKLIERVSVEDHFIAGEADATNMIQRAIDSGAANIELQGIEYLTSAPLYMDGGQALIGKSSAKTIIKKTTTTVGAGSNLARAGTVTDSYAKNAILILRHADNGFNYNTTIEGVQLKSNGYIVDYGIYAPRMTHAFFKDVYIFQCKYGFVTNDAWLNTFIKVIANANSVDPAGVPAVAASAYGWAGSYGFWWQDDGTGNATGTSLNAIDCWARDCHNGWHLYGLQYSTLNSCAADNISNIPYRFHLCKLTLNGCGTEKTQIGQGSYSMESSHVTMNSCQSQTQRGNAAGTTAALYISGGVVTMNSCVFDNFTTANATYNVIIQSGAKVINNGSILPTNGNAYIGYGGGSQYINNNNVPPYIATAAGIRYMAGRARDNQVQEKTAKAVLSAGTVIATLTCNGGAGVESAAVRFKITWFDTAFASCVGVSNVEVVCYQDGGANYRQAINTSVNVGAGNGYTTAPSYSIARSGNTWSVTMTPAHGDVTCNTITAEAEVISGFTIALT